MGLRETAATDLKTILEDSAAGFGWPITVTDPNGKVASLVGLSGDIAQVIDPQTGVPVTGRLAHVSIAMASLAAAGLEHPTGVTDRGRRPWVVKFNDIEGKAHTFKVIEGLPDRTIGIITCTLEAYLA